VAPSSVTGSGSQKERARREEGVGKNKREGGVALGKSPGVLLIARTSRRWRSETSRPPRTCYQLEDEDDVHFAQNPLGFGGFQGEIKTAHFCKIL
jgi:hypothetical protein